MAQIIRVGFVNARQPEKMRVKVTIPDTTGAELVTDFLPVLCPRACEDMQYDLPDVGDQVLCLFLSYGLEQGFVIGAMYGKQALPVQSGDKWHRKFKDGASLEYDRAAHALNAVIPGTATIKCNGPITLEAPIVYVRGTLVNTARDGSPGKSVFSGGMTVTDGGVSVPDADVQASGVSLTSHTTDGVQPGGGQSLHPTGGSSTSPGTATQGGSSGNSSSGSGAGEPDTSGSSETESGGNGGLPDAGSLAGGIGGALLASSQKHLEALSDEVRETGSNIDKLIMCLPQIAEIEAEDSNADNAKGWLYLKAMFEKWLSGAANEDALANPSVLWVDFDWMLSYFRAWATYQFFITKLKLFNDAGRNSLAAILKRDHKFSDSERIEFNYITPDWKNWRRDYFQQIPVYGMAAIPPDGLMAAMGNFNLRALASGCTEPVNGSHRITVENIAIFIWDSFNFEGNTELGYWRCEPPKFSYLPFPEARILENADFNAFRHKYGRGSDFLVLSQLKEVDNFGAYSYEA